MKEVKSAGQISHNHARFSLGEMDSLLNPGEKLTSLHFLKDEVEPKENKHGLNTPLNLNDKLTE